MSGLEIRPAAPGDERAVAELLVQINLDDWLRFTARERATDAVAACFRRPWTDASSNVVTIADLDGCLAGAMVTFPASQRAARYAITTVLCLRHMPSRTWRKLLHEMRRDWRASPHPPRASFYVDSLVTARDARRRGVASALLAHAETQARSHGLPWLALDTGLENRPARALYEGFGFVERARRGSLPGDDGLVLYLKDLRRDAAPRRVRHSPSTLTTSRFGRSPSHSV